MLHDKESIAENEIKNVQNSGLKALKLGIIFIQATLSCSVVNVVQDCVKHVSYLCQRQHCNSCTGTGTSVEVK